MKDNIFYGNLLGLLKQGKWTLSLQEASALIQIYQETERRLKGEPVVEDKKEPIKKVKNASK